MPGANLKNPALSVVFSFRNEEPVLPILLERLEKVFTAEKIDYELIFVNDASTDASLKILSQKAQSDSRIKILTMSRRFGVYPCILAGLNHARGEAVIMMDADLQDPPEVIPELIKKWQEGAEVVYTVRTRRKGESTFKTFLTRGAYKIIRAVTKDVDLTVEAGDFRLLSRRVLGELLKSNDRQPYLRGLIRSLGFRQEPVYYEREKRFAGETHVPLLSGGPIGVFVAGVLSFSSLPLDFSFVAGIFLMAVSFPAVFLLSLMKLTGFFAARWMLITACLLLFTGLQLFSIGLLGFYLVRICRHIQNRPFYIIESAMNLETDSAFSPQYD